MEVLAVIGIIAAFALICAAIYWVGRSLQRKGHDLNFVDPRYPYPDNDTSLFRDDDEKNAPGQDRHESS